MGLPLVRRCLTQSSSQPATSSNYHSRVRVDMDYCYHSLSKLLWMNNHYSCH